MNERVIQIRKANKLTQMEFAEKLGFTQANLSSIELGKTVLTEANIRLICLTFGVHEQWLKTGEGPIFTEEAPGQKQLIEAFRGLTLIGRKTVLKIVETLVEAEEEQGWNREVASPENEGQKDE